MKFLLLEQNCQNVGQRSEDDKGRCTVLRTPQKSRGPYRSGNIAKLQKSSQFMMSTCKPQDIQTIIEAFE